MILLIKNIFFVNYKEFYKKKKILMLKFLIFNFNNLIVKILKND